MKTFTSLIAVALEASLAMSCVSSRKYNDAVCDKNEMLQKYISLEEDYENLEGIRHRMEGQIRRLETSLKMEKEMLSNKENALNEEQKRLQDMKALVDAERKAVLNLRQEVWTALKHFTPGELQMAIKDGKPYVSVQDGLPASSGKDGLNPERREVLVLLNTALDQSDLNVVVQSPSPYLIYEDWNINVSRPPALRALLVTPEFRQKKLSQQEEAYFIP